MPQKKRPEQRSMSSETPAPDQSRPQPTGNETYTTPPAKAERPARDTGAATGEPEQAEWDRYLNESIVRLQEAAIGYFDRLGEAAGDVTEQARKVYADSRTYVGSHPGSTVGGAFLFGVLVGFLMDRD